MAFSKGIAKSTYHLHGAGIASDGAHGQTPLRIELSSASSLDTWAASSLTSVTTSGRDDETFVALTRKATSSINHGSRTNSDTWRKSWTGHFPEATSIKRWTAKGINEHGRYWIVGAARTDQDTERFDEKKLFCKLKFHLKMFA